MQLVNKKDFVEAVLNHKEGFLISTGDADGDRNAPFEIHSIFFDSVNINYSSIDRSKGSYNNSFLSFSNTLNTKDEGNGRLVASSIHEFSISYIDTNSIVSIREYDGDYLSDTFVTGVQRVFEIEIKDETECDTNSLYCIGLL